MSASRLKEASSYRSHWDLGLVCGPDRSALWEHLNEVGGSTLGECCYVTVSNSLDQSIFLSCYGGDDRFGTFLFDVKHVFPHTSESFPDKQCMRPGYCGGTVQKILSKAESEVYDGYISFSLDTKAGRKYTVCCCWSEWHQEGGLCGTKAGIVARCADEGETEHPDGNIETVVDICKTHYIGDGVALEIFDEKTSDFKVICSFRRSAFHFEICSLTPTSATECSGFCVTDLEDSINGRETVVTQMESLAVQLPDVTFSCICIENRCPVALKDPTLNSLMGHFFTPCNAIKDIHPGHRLGTIHTQTQEGDNVCSGWVQYRLHFLRDDYVACIGWYVDAPKKEYCAGLELRVVPKLLDRRDAIDRNGVNEFGDIADPMLFVKSILPPPQCHASLRPGHRTKSRNVSVLKDSLDRLEKREVERLQATVMFTKEQFRFKFNITDGLSSKTGQNKR